GGQQTYRFLIWGLFAAPVFNQLSYASSYSVMSGFLSLKARRNPIRTRPPANMNEMVTPRSMPSAPCYGIIVFVKMETSSAVPTAPTTWRIALIIAVPCGTSVMIICVIPAVVIGIMTMDTPRILNALTTARYVNVDSVSNVVNIREVTATMARPTMASHLAPYLTKSRPVIGLIIPMMIAPGNSIMPDAIAENPSMFCISIGSMTDPPIIAMKTIMPSAVVNVKILSLNTANSNIGCSR